MAFGQRCCRNVTVLQECDTVAEMPHRNVDQLGQVSVVLQKCDTVALVQHRDFGEVWQNCNTIRGDLRRRPEPNPLISFGDFGRDPGQGSARAWRILRRLLPVQVHTHTIAPLYMLSTAETWLTIALPVLLYTYGTEHKTSQEAQR